MAEISLNAFFDGRDAEIAYVLGSRSHQFDYLDDRGRRIVGRRRWIDSARAREISADQQFYEKLASLYEKFINHEEEERKFVLPKQRQLSF